MPNMAFDPSVQNSESNTQLAHLDDFTHACTSFMTETDAICHPPTWSGAAAQAAHQVVSEFVAKSAQLTADTLEPKAQAIANLAHAAEESEEQWNSTIQTIELPTFHI